MSKEIKYKPSEENLDDLEKQKIKYDKRRNTKYVKIIAGDEQEFVDATDQALHTHVKANDTDFATETTLKSIKSKTDKLTFDASNNLKIDF